ncbi:AraC family transcriptional regulator [Paenibacillus profundus]|uniref:AraC family transcriptional regulator n=1 Tax=Paenibacillus profundus TaxID=1173085 RepID=A0ABS8YFY8_9BACL|nr:AraC family transcriptional regulator [Paenibacillus profundus]MCE5170913.1 AraC family transcriptional regulator [Paenibacillus profundus]
MNLSEHIVLWNHASVRLMDIRHTNMKAGEELQFYNLPASFFLFAARGGAHVQLDGVSYHTKRFHLLHGGKGTCLDIYTTKEEFEYYLILYKAVIPLPCRQEILELMNRIRPFQLQYKIVPYSPLSFLEKIEEMDRKWRMAGELEHFHVKALFYQCVYELLQQLQREGGHIVETGPVSQAVRYMQDHYEELITLDSLADKLNCSVGHLGKLFKSEINYSPIQYLTQIRIKEAKELLLASDATLEEIAIRVGYPDKYYFSRIFKKHTGTSPIQFRNRLGTVDKNANRPLRWRRTSIGGRKLGYYSNNDNNNRYQCYREGDIPMLKSTKMLAAILFCLSLFLSACSGASTTSGNVTGGVQAAPGQESQAGTADKTRTISTIKGDIKIPDKPQRIVVDLYLGSFIALNVKPIGTPEKNLKNPYYSNKLEGVENIGEYEAISLEKIVALQPDLIVTGNEPAYDSFSKIAPTILVPFGNLKTAHEEVAYFGKVLGKEREAEAWLADYDKRIADARAKLDKVVPAEATFSIMEDWGKMVGVFGDNFGRGGQAVYQALGRKLPVKHAAEIMEQQSVEVSMEVIHEFVGDYIIFTSDKHTYGDLKSDPIWGTLDAVKNDRVYIWKSEKSWYFDPIATLSQMEELAAWLAGE